MPEVKSENLIREGLELRNDRRLELALEKFQAAGKADPHDADLYFYTGEVQTDLGDYRAARVAYRGAVEVLTTAIDAPASNSTLDLARLYNDRGVAKVLSDDLESAVLDFDEAISLNGGSYPQAQRSRGRVLLALGWYADAHEAYEGLLEESWARDDASTHDGLAQLYAANDDPEKALSEARRALDLGSEKATLYLLLARSLRAAGENEDAEAEATTALREAAAVCEGDIAGRRDPPVAMYLLAHTQLEQKDGRAATTFADAIERLTKGGAEPRHLFAAYAGYGLALSAEERFDEALRACREAALLEAPSAEQRENLDINLAYVLSQVGRVDEAVSTIKAVVNKPRIARRLAESGRPGAKPSFAPGWYVLGSEGLIRMAAAEKYGDRESWSSAVRAFERASKAAPDRVPKHDKAAYGVMRLREGYCKWQLGDLRGAANSFRNAKAALPEDSPAYVDADDAELRVSVEQSSRLPRLLPHVTTAIALVLVAAITVLEADHRLSAGAWASVVLGLALLALASWCLPAIRTLKIGGAEFTKEVNLSEAVPVVDLPRAPMLSVPTPPDFPRPNLKGVEAQSVEVLERRADVSADAAPIAQALHDALARAKAGDDHALVRDALRQSPVYALGTPAGVVKDGTGTESDLLHFTIDDHETGKEAVMLPVFTAPSAMQEALQRNPDWQSLSVLQIDGGALDENVDPDVRIVIDPWTDDEHQLLSRDDREPVSDGASDVTDGT